METELRPRPPTSRSHDSPFCHVRRLPDPSLDEDWQRIIVPDHIKTRLLRHIKVLSLLAQCGASDIGLALRRAVLLYGPPGTGKTSLGRGLANEWAKASGQSALLVVANAHAVPSGERGGSQKNVQTLFRDLSEIASTGQPVVVLFDEVESMGTNRANLNSDTNPADTSLSVNSFIESLDELVRKHHNVVLIFTTNIPRDIDPAITERVDFSMLVPLPDAQTRRSIICNATLELDRLCGSDVANSLRSALASERANDLLELTHGQSPRQSRHLIVSALTYAPSLQELEFNHLIQAAQAQKEEEIHNRQTGGVYTHAYQQT